MSRIRNIKPEFFIDPDLQDLENEHPGKYLMLTYAGLWTQCSKNGVFLYEPRILHLYILPFIEYDFTESLRILCEAGFIKRFQVGQKKYGYIPTFSEHQRISGQENTQPAKYPDYVEGTDWEASQKPAKNTKNNSEPQQGSNREATGKQQGSNREARGIADLGVGSRDIGVGSTDIGVRTPPREEAYAAPAAEPSAEPPALADPDAYIARMKARTGEGLHKRIQDAFEKVSGQFANYGKEGSAIKRIIKLTSGDEHVIHVMLETFYRLTKSGDRFWSRQPFSPSTMVSLWERVKLEAQERVEIEDTSWLEAANDCQ